MNPYAPTLDLGGLGGLGLGKGDNLALAQSQSHALAQFAQFPGVIIEPYIYHLSMTIAAAAALGTPGVEEDDTVVVADADFICTHLGIRYDTGGAAATGRFRIFDDGATYSFMQGKIATNGFFNANLEPYALPIPYRFRQGAIARAIADNLKTTADTTRLALIGYKLKGVEKIEENIEAIDINIRQWFEGHAKPWFVEADFSDNGNVTIANAASTSRSGDVVGDHPFVLVDYNAVSFRTTDYNPFVSTNLFIFSRIDGKQLSNERMSLATLTGLDFRPYRLPASVKYRAKAGIYTEGENQTGSAIFLRVNYNGIKILRDIAGNGR